MRLGQVTNRQQITFSIHQGHTVPSAVKNLEQVLFFTETKLSESTHQWQHIIKQVILQFSKYIFYSFLLLLVIGMYCSQAFPYRK